MAMISRSAQVYLRSIRGVLAIGLTACFVLSAKADIISLAGTSVAQAYVGTVSSSPSCPVYCAGALDTIAVASGTPTVSDLTQALTNFNAGTPNPFASIQGRGFSPVGGATALWSATASADDTVTSGSATILASTSLTPGGAPIVQFNPFTYTGPLNTTPGTASVYVLMMTFDYTLDGSGLNAGNLAFNLGGTCSTAQSATGGTCLAGAMVDVLGTGIPGSGPGYSVLASCTAYPCVNVSVTADGKYLAANAPTTFGPTPAGATGLEVNAIVFMEGTSPAVAINLSGSGDLGSDIPEPRPFALTASALCLMGLVLRHSQARRRLGRYDWDRYSRQK